VPNKNPMTTLLQQQGIPGAAAEGAAAGTRGRPLECPGTKGAAAGTEAHRGSAQDEGRSRRNCGYAAGHPSGAAGTGVQRMTSLQQQYGLMPGTSPGAGGRAQGAPEAAPPRVHLGVQLSWQGHPGVHATLCAPFMQ